MVVLPIGPIGGSGVAATRPFPSALPFAALPFAARSFAAACSFNMRIVRQGDFYPVAKPVGAVGDDQIGRAHV